MLEDLAESKVRGETAPVRTVGLIEWPLKILRTKPHIMDLPESIPRTLELRKRLQDRFSVRHFEELLQFFTIPTDHDVDHQGAAFPHCLAALQDIAFACTACTGSSPSMVAATVKRILSALDGIIYWVCNAMHVPLGRGNRAFPNATWKMDVSHSYGIHGAISIFLSKIALLDEGILQKQAFDPLILDLCLMWNVVARDGAPVLHYEWARPRTSHCPHYPHSQK